MSSPSHPPSPTLVDALVDALEDCLPQTQCTQCGYPGCREYATAVAAGETGIDGCPPGGEFTRRALAEALRIRPPSAAPPATPPEPAVPQVAFIHEDECIGCTRCIQVCPVDCIIGAAKRMHTVIADACSGCMLCVPVCPTDCITPAAAAPPRGAPSPWPEFSQAQVETFRRRAHHKRHRAAQHQQEREAHTRARRTTALQREIRAAVERAATRRAVAPWRRRAAP